MMTSSCRILSSSDISPDRKENTGCSPNGLDLEKGLLDDGVDPFFCEHFSPLCSFSP